LTTGDNRLPTGAALNVGQSASANLGTFDLNGFNQQVAGLNSVSGINTTSVKNTVTNSVASPVTLTLSGSGVYAYGGGSTNNPGVIVGQINLVKGGSGTQTLGDTNTYTGNTTISGGILSLGAVGSIATSPKIILAGGATFDVSGLLNTNAVANFTNIFLLGSGQTLSNNTSTAALNGSANTGSGTVSLTYASGTPSLTVTNGTLTLSASTAFKVNNTGATLTHGSYKIISKATTGNAGLVAGTAPSVTVGGNGVTSGATPSLSINSSELNLVVPNQAPTINNIVTNNVTSGFMWKTAITNLATAAGWSDPDGDAVSLSSVANSANGVSVTKDSIYVYYNAPVTNEDHFDYTIGDGNLTVNGTVYLEAIASNGYFTQNYTTPPLVNGNGSVTLNLASIPDSTNIVQVATNLTPPINWISISTNVAGTNGLWQFTDTNPPSTAFYRTAKP